MTEIRCRRALMASRFAGKAGRLRRDRRPLSPFAVTAGHRTVHRPVSAGLRSLKRAGSEGRRAESAESDNFWRDGSTSISSSFFLVPSVSDLPPAESAARRRDSDRQHVLLRSLYRTAVSHAMKSSSVRRVLSVTNSITFASSTKPRNGVVSGIKSNGSTK